MLIRGLIDVWYNIIYSSLSVIAVYKKGTSKRYCGIAFILGCRYAYVKKHELP